LLRKKRLYFCHLANIHKKIKKKNNVLGKLSVMCYLCRSY
jgi:hypothetical protein